VIASNETFVTAAYALTWVVLLGYVWRLHARDSRARADEARVRVEGPR
jgi:CcmD family protein